MLYFFVINPPTNQMPYSILVPVGLLQSTNFMFYTKISMLLKGFYVDQRRRRYQFHFFYYYDDVFYLFY